MRVLWTSNILFPCVAEAMGLHRTSGCSGAWMFALAEELSQRCGEVQLGIVTMHPALAAATQTIGGITYHVVPCEKADLLRRPGKRLVVGFRKIIEEFAPDIIHVHGSEYSYGLVVSDASPNTPTVMEIQGIIGECWKHYLNGLSFWNIIRYRTLRDWLRLDGLVEQPFRWRRRAKMEGETFRRMKHLIGRTTWDRAHARERHPDAQYHHSDEILRRPFREAQWHLESARRHMIFTSSCSYPLKGFHVLLAAVHLLKRDYPDIELRVPGPAICRGGTISSLGKRLRETGYSHYLADRIYRYGLESCVKFLGDLDADGMADEFVRAHAYVHPSFLENSPNALAEAMSVGTPSVAAYTGGIPSMANDGVDVLYHPAGDAAVLAEQIRSVFEDDVLAKRLSANARGRALARHDPGKVVGDLLAIYGEIVAAQDGHTTTKCKEAARQ